MPLDPSISLQVQTPNPTGYIGSLLDLGLKKNALTRSNATLLSDIAQSKAQSSLAQTQADVASQVAPSQVSQAQSVAGTAQAQMSQAQLDNLRAHTANVVQQLETLRNDPQINRKKVIQSVVDSATNVGAPTAAITQALQGLPDTDDPASLRQFVTQGLVRAQAVSNHLNSVSPAPTFVDNGQQVVPVASGNPSVTGVPAGTPQGVPTQKVLPPTATTMRGGQPVYVGPQGGSQPGQGQSVPSGPAIGQVEGTTGPIQVANQHFQQVQAAAQAAPTRIAALQTIMQEAPQAITGGGDYRRKFLSQVSGLFGIGTTEQTSNDVMAKNLSLIAGAAGNTDAARALSEMANPNYHMTQAAIQQTGQQLIGIERKNQVAGEFFSGIPTNDPSYATKMAQWNKVADPRLFEYAALPKEEKAAWIAKLSPAVKAELARKAQVLHEMGVSP